MKPFIEQWFWAICILVMLVNGAISWVRAQKRIKDHPEDRPHYVALIRGYII